MTSRKATDSFYVRMGFLLIVLLFLGFTPFVKHRFDQSGTMSPVLLAHSVMALGWFVLYTYQASLVSAGNLKRHITLGKASLIFSVFFVITAILVMQDTFSSGSNGGTPFSPTHFIILPFMDIILFMIFYTLAYRNRRSAETHKHYMLLTGVVMMDPALARMGLSVDFIPLGALLHFGLLMIVLMYDRRNLGHVHTATKIAFAAIALRMVALFTVGPTDAWTKFTHMLFG